MTITDDREAWLRNHCDFQENLTLAIKIEKKEMPTYCSTKITNMDGVVNCVMFAMQPPRWLAYGVQSCIVPINLDPSRFRKECLLAFGKMKESSDYIKTRFASEIENGPKTNRLPHSLRQRNAIGHFRIPTKIIDPGAN